MSRAQGSRKALAFWVYAFWVHEASSSSTLCYHFPSFCTHADTCGLHTFQGTYQSSIMFWESETWPESTDGRLFPGYEIINYVFDGKACR